jgi:FixJ family two-component response regulator
LLTSAGWSVESFNDPGRFLLYAQVHRSPVAIIDIWMPAMNGLEVQSRLRDVSPSTRVIILTGKEDPLVRATALNAGASGFFLKPFDDEEFLTAVRMALAAVD